MSATIEVNVLSNALAQAAVVTLLLAEKGISVIGAYANGRRPVLAVTHLPEGVESAIKVRHPNGRGGSTEILAAQYHGCQIEAMRDVPGKEQPFALRVVGRG